MATAFRRRSRGGGSRPPGTTGSWQPNSSIRTTRVPISGAIRANGSFRRSRTALRRLGTDYIDILYFHRAVFDAPLDEAVRAIADLIRQGKLRYFAVSNFRAWRIAEVAHLADQFGIDRPVASQPLYNIFNRTAEAEQIPAAAYYGLGVVSYSPLARGVLTGKYDPGQKPAPDSRAGRNDKRILETEWRPESLKIAQQIRLHAEARGIWASDFAIAWVLNNRLITSAIAGPRTEAQWDSYAGGARRISDGRGRSAG